MLKTISACVNVTRRLKFRSTLSQVLRSRNACFRVVHLS